MIPLYFAEIPIIFSCNLNCNWCCLLSPYMKKVPLLTLEEVEATCSGWSQKLQLQEARIIGGEPLLHPNITEILDIFGEYWKPPTQILILTNGLLLETMSETFFEQLEKWNVILRITIQHNRFREQIMNSCHRLREGSFHFLDHDVSGSWRKLYQLEEGTPKLFVSDSKKAHEACSFKHICRAIINNELYQCTIFAYMRKCYDYGIINDDRLLIHKPATLDMSPDELQQWLDADYSESCCVCPETCFPVDINEKKFHR